MITPPELRSTSANSGAPAETMVELRVKVPRGWRDELQRAAATRAISMSDLARILLRDFLRGRYEESSG